MKPKQRHQKCNHKDHWTLSISRTANNASENRPSMLKHLVSLLLPWQHAIQFFIGQWPVSFLNLSIPAHLLYLHKRNHSKSAHTIITMNEYQKFCTTALTQEYALTVVEHGIMYQTHPTCCNICTLEHRLKTPAHQNTRYSITPQYESCVFSETSDSVSEDCCLVPRA